MAEEIKVEEEVVTMISKVIRPKLTEFTTIANTYNILNPKSSPIKIENDAEWDIIINYNHEPIDETSILYMCQFCTRTSYSKTKLRTYKDIIYPSTTPMPEPEPPDPHPQATQSIQAQIPMIWKILGLPTI